MNAFVIISLIALVLLILSGLKKDRAGSKYVEDLKAGRLFRDFDLDKYTVDVDVVLALDRKHRRVGLARATYFTDRDGDRRHVPVTIAVDIDDIKSIKPFTFIQDEGASFWFELRRPIPPENDSNSLQISGRPSEIGPLVEEIKSLFRVQ